MSQLAHILADGEGIDSLLDLLPFLVVIVIGFIIKLISSAAKQKQTEQQKQRWDEIREERARALQEELRQNREAHAQGQAQAPPAPPRPAPQEQPVALQPVALQPAVLQPAAHRPARKPKRRPQPPPPLPPEPDEVESTVAQLAPEHPDDADASREPAGLDAAALALGDARTAREAIIYHEILSTPKALRRGTESWDL